MVTLANQSVKSAGTSAFKILYLLYKSQFDEKTSLRPDTRREVIESMIGRFNALVNNNRVLAKELRKSFSDAIKKDSSFSLYCFSQELE